MRCSCYSTLHFNKDLCSTTWSRKWAHAHSMMLQQHVFDTVNCCLEWVLICKLAGRLRTNMHDFYSTNFRWPKKKNTKKVSDSSNLLKVSQACNYSYILQCWSRQGGTRGQNHETSPQKLYHISNYHTFFSHPVQVILVPYCCLFCVLSNDMLIVFI